MAERHRARWYLVGVLYLALVPVGVVIRVVRDPLRARRPRRSNWRAAPRTVTALEEARRGG
jgi:hypothetical protein